MLRCIRMLCFLAVAASASAQLTPADIVPGRLIVVYRTPSVPADADAVLNGTRAHVHLSKVGVSLVRVAPGEEDATITRLSSRGEVAAVLHDLRVEGHTMQNVAPVTVSHAQASAVHGPLIRMGGVLADAGYASPAGWAVRASGGFGNGVPGGPAVGPWNRSMGAGVRIAVLDSGIDEHHPDLAPNLALNMSEVDQQALPSPCDDGSPQDQQGHGTWAASLVAAAIGTGTGELIGVAPQATLLNIKVLERMPASTGATLIEQCEAGQPGGLLSWVLAGIDDAIAQKADIISFSLGSLVDLTTGDGAGWKASFDRVTYAAQQAGVVIVAAAGNDGLDLSTGHFAEMPAQARGVLAVTASTNPACAENLAAEASCAPGPVTRPYYSNYGGNVLNAIAAPGGSYPEGPDAGVSGWVRGACSMGLRHTPDGLPSDGRSFGCFGLGHVPYVQAMGTSAAAPLVAGAAALLHASRPDWSAAQIVDALRSSAAKLPAMDEPELDVPAALALP